MVLCRQKWSIVDLCHIAQKVISILKFSPNCNEMIFGCGIKRALRSAYDIHLRKVANKVVSNFIFKI
jgi:hypothetical protein